MNERQERFIALLNQIFEMDKSDLDFGIYRILNIRRTEIQKFFNEGLPKQITNILEPFAQGNKEELRQKIANIEAQCGGAEFVATLPDTMPMKQQYNTLKAQLQQGTDLSALESDVYSALYNFFSRYYDEGDFISKRRYKEGVYAIPYEGEEVKLYWANQDQYYIKTSENFKDYTFTAGDYTVHFLLVDATTEQNNNKENDANKRQFMLFTEDAEKYPNIKTFEFKEEEKTVNIRFIFDIPEDKKAKYQELNATAIKQWLSSQPTYLWTELLRPYNPDAKTKDQISIIEKHLKAYIAKNTFDYFIHKDLGGFLNRELDFFIKNEVMHLDDLDSENEARVETYISKVRAIKQVGRVIIRFLAQIENFQKKLWLKKKFVVETNWCITLDRIPEVYYDEIRNNKAQIQEWIDLYAIDELEIDLEHTETFTSVPSILFLKQNQNLIVDTKYFSEEFKYRLIAEFDDLDKETDGLMLNSENFQALELLQERYKGKVKCAYYDPPYNTSEGTFLYKNNYKQSSWCTMASNRWALTSPLLTTNGIVESAIDDFEQPYFSCVLDGIFGFDNRLGTLAIETKPSGRTNDYFLATCHEYLLCYAKEYSNTQINFVPLTEDQKKVYKDVTLDGTPTKWRDFIRTGGYSTPAERPNSYYPIYYNESTGDITTDKQNGYITIYPIDSVGKHRVWRKTIPSFKEHLMKGEIKIEKVNNSYKVKIIDKIKEGLRPKSMWYGSKYDASSHGTKLLKNIFGDASFSFPKSLFTVYDSIKLVCNDGDLILDAFGGSGTTAHAVININREKDQEDENCKYIMCEMAEYFKNVTHPRIKKIVYSPDWKDGRPKSRNNGITHIMKYLRLESYEDALNNIKLKEVDFYSSLFGEDYMINYMFDIESKESLLNLKAFNSPFSYEMFFTENNEKIEHKVDVCETFNYLIGLTVQHQGIIRSYDSRPAAYPDYEGAVDLVKGNQYAFRQIEGTLPDGRKALIIWRTISEDLLACNAALDAYFAKYRINPLDREYDVIYVNGDNNLENLRTSSETWKVVLIEQEFNKRMFEEE